MPLIQPFEHVGKAISYHLTLTTGLVDQLKKYLITMRKFAPIVLLLVCVFVVGLQVERVAAVSKAAAVEFDLTPHFNLEDKTEQSFTAGSPVTLKVAVKGKSVIQSVFCFFWFNDNLDNLYSCALQYETVGVFSGVIPEPSSDIETIHYAFAIVTPQGQAVVSEVKRVARGQTHWERISRDYPDSSFQIGMVFAQDDWQEDFLSPATVDISVHQQQSDLAARLSLYTPEPFSGYEKGYFGGFIYGYSDGNIDPIEGWVQFADMQSNGLKSGTSKRRTYPDLNGTNWSGSFYIYNPSTRERYDHESVNADIVVSTSGSVGIKTSFTDWRESFYGSVNVYGDMVLYDRFDDETWTTKYYQASPTLVHIADYVDQTFEELYIINLQRAYPSSLPGPPSLMSPVTGTEVGSATSGCTLKWKAVNLADHYNIQIGDRCSEGAIYEASDITYFVGGLERGTTYYWKVRGVGDGGYAGTWSSCWYFTKGENPLLKPTLHLLLLRTE